METLDGTEWDVVISDTGFVSSLLALSLSRSGKRILHLDRNEYYGGDEAALSLSEAEAWAKRFSQTEANSRFSHASVVRPDRNDGEGDNRLSSSRAYSLALAPYLIYARSNLVSTLVSSRSHNQLDFQAVGSWFVLNTSSEQSEPQSRLIRVPNGREDVFQDSSLDLKAKRSLMKFLRFVAAHEEQTETWQEHEDLPFSSFLEQKFGLPAKSHEAILALTMSQASVASTKTKTALPRIARHLRSIGIFGPGFGAVLPKWGGLAEIAQVACRACAVGGGVYVLNKSIQNVTQKTDNDWLSLELSDGEKVSTSWLCGSCENLPTAHSSESGKSTATVATSRSISIVSSSLESLFPPTSEGGVTPAGAVIMASSPDASEPPVHMFVHTADAGECPMNQNVLTRFEGVIYASVALSQEQGIPRLESAVSALLASIGEQPEPAILWSLRYQQQSPRTELVNSEGGVISLPSLSQELVLEDFVLDSVKSAWQSITGENDDDFMKFQPREGLENEDD